MIRTCRAVQGGVGKGEERGKSYRPWRSLDFRETQVTYANYHPWVEPALCHCGFPTVAGGGVEHATSRPSSCHAAARPSPRVRVSPGAHPLVSPPHQGEVTRPWGAVGEGLKRWMKGQCKLEAAPPHPCTRARHQADTDKQAASTDFMRCNAKHTRVCTEGWGWGGGIPCMTAIDPYMYQVQVHVCLKTLTKHYIAGTSVCTPTHTAEEPQAVLLHFSVSPCGGCRRQSTNQQAIFSILAENLFQM